MATVAKVSPWRGIAAARFKFPRRSSRPKDHKKIRSTCAEEGMIMNELLARIVDAHGGIDRWNRYERVEATIVSGGGLFRLKGVPQDSTARRMTVWLHAERSSVFPYGAPDQRTMFTPENVAFEKLDGATVAQRQAPRDSFAGHQMATPWDVLYRAYFNGYASGHISRLPSFSQWTECGSRRQMLGGRGKKLGASCAHISRVRLRRTAVFRISSFGEDLMLRRHDYCVNIAGGFEAAQLTSDYVIANGIHLPTKRRAYTRGSDRRPITEMLMVSIDISEVRYLE
jgi:hypothetical protein